MSRKFSRAEVRARLEGFQERQRDRGKEREPQKDYCRKYNAKLRTAAKKAADNSAPPLRYPPVRLVSSRGFRSDPARRFRRGPTAARRGTRHESTCLHWSRRTPAGLLMIRARAGKYSSLVWRFVSSLPRLTPTGTLPPTRRTTADHRCRHSALSAPPEDSFQRPQIGRKNLLVPP